MCHRRRRSQRRPRKGIGQSANKTRKESAVKESGRAGLELALVGLGVTVSAACWLLAGSLNQALSGIAGYSDGVDLVFLPAGIRLGLILVFRGWAALGISLADPVLFQATFGEGSTYEIAIISLIAGFVPLLSVIIISRMMNVDHNLSRLTPLVLMCMALAASVLTPLAFNVSLLGFGRIGSDEFIARLFAMILGDFLGCLVVLVILNAAIRMWRRF